MTISNDPLPVLYLVLKGKRTLWEDVHRFSIGATQGFPHSQPDPGPDPGLDPDSDLDPNPHLNPDLDSALDPHPNPDPNHLICPPLS